jgi:hypothetical protein
MITPWIVYLLKGTGTQIERSYNPFGIDIQASVFGGGVQALRNVIPNDVISGMKLT